MSYGKKLIEVALPLDAINQASAREKSIRHGHPSTLHLWWARRPLAAARAVIFAQMVDDPSAYVDELRRDPNLLKKAERELNVRKKVWDDATRRAHDASQADVAAPPPGPEPTLDEILAELERKRLFDIIEELVLWENTTNESVLQKARDEIRKSWRRACAENAKHPQAKDLFNPEKLPAFHDPFAGGGALPLEAQRLGLEAHASDLNPVAVLICKAMIEIPPKFAGKPPVNPDWQEKPEEEKANTVWQSRKGAKRIGRRNQMTRLAHGMIGGEEALTLDRDWLNRKSSTVSPEILGLRRVRCAIDTGTATEVGCRRATGSFSIGRSIPPTAS